MARATFANGYVLRCMIRYLTGIPEVTLRLSSAGIAFIEMTSRRDNINYMFLQANDGFMKYSYDGQEPMRYVRIALTNLSAGLEVLTVKSGQAEIIFTKDSSPGQHYYLYTSNESVPGAWTKVCPLEILPFTKHEEIDLPDYDPHDANLYVTTISAFAKECKELYVVGMVYTEIRNYLNGSRALILSARDKNDKVLKLPRLVSNDTLTAEAPGALQKTIEQKDEDAVKVSRDIVNLWKGFTGMGGKQRLYIYLGDQKPLKLAINVAGGSWVISYISNPAEAS